jgi:hypothetical protein
MSLSLALLVLTAGAPERLAVHPPLMPSLSKKERQQLSGLEGEILETLAKQARWVLVDESDVKAALASSGGACPSAPEKLSACLVTLLSAVRANAGVVVDVKATGPGRFVVGAQFVRREGAAERADEAVEVPPKAPLLTALLPAINRLVAQVMVPPVAEPPPPPVLTPTEPPKPETPPPTPPPPPPVESPRRALVGPLVSASAAALGLVAVGLGLDNAARANRLVSNAMAAMVMGPPWPLASPQDQPMLQQLDRQSTMTVGFSIGAAVLLGAGLVLWLAGL